MTVHILNGVITSVFCIEPIVFCKLFDWFSLTSPELLDYAEALSDGSFYLNSPGDRTPLGLDNSESGRALKSEAEIEKNLCLSPLFKDHFHLEKVDRQLPVGLFRNCVARHNRIFTGGKSAIDLIGIGGDTLWLFELKAGKNIPAGILSELLFYASVLREAVGDRARFQFDPRGKNRGPIHQDDIRRCRQINAVLLGEQLHPLIGDPRVLACLKTSVDRNWNTQDQVPLNFSATIMTLTAGADDRFANMGYATGMAA